MLPFVTWITGYVFCTLDSLPSTIGLRVMAVSWVVVICILRLQTPSSLLQWSDLTHFFLVEHSSVIQDYAQIRAKTANVPLKGIIYLPSPIPASLLYPCIDAPVLYSILTQFLTSDLQWKWKNNDTKQKTPSYYLTVSLFSSLADQSSPKLWDRSEDWLRCEERGAAQCTQAAQHSVF